LLPGLSFHTEGPGGHFDLNALLDVLLDSQFTVGVPIIGGLDVLPDPLEHLSQRVEERIIHLSTDDPSTDFHFPGPAGFSLDMSFPHRIDVDGSVQGSDPLSVASGSEGSGNFATLNWNIGEGISEFAPILSPLFVPLPVVVPPLVGTITPIVASVGMGAEFSQDFTLTMQQLGLKVVLEDNTSWDFDASGGVTIPDASKHEVNGIDGLQFSVVMDPHAQLHTESDLDFNFDWALKLLDTHLNVPINIGAITDFLHDIPFIGDEIPDHIGINQALVPLGGSDIPVASIDIHDNDFQLQFQQAQSGVLAA
jgi:hypothetical protein